MSNIQLPAECLHIIYCSRLAPGADYTAYGDICRAARRRHLDDGVSSVLLFDGHRFCQWLQGELGAVAALMHQIAGDTRHTALTTRLHAVMPFCSFAQGWRAGFVDSEGLDRFQQLDGTAPDQVLSAFGRLLAAADIEPAMSISDAATAGAVASGAAASQCYGGDRI